MDSLKLPHSLKQLKSANCLSVPKVFCQCSPISFPKMILGYIPGKKTKQGGGGREDMEFLRGIEEEVGIPWAG